jgi:hypothetical protein
MLIAILLVLLASAFLTLSAVGSLLLKVDALSDDIYDLAETVDDGIDYAAAVTKQQARITRKHLTEEIAKCGCYVPTEPSADERLLQSIIEKRGTGC